MSRRRSTFLAVGGSPAAAPGSTRTDERLDIQGKLHALATERGGRIVETTSRDLVAGFPTPVAALECALALHRELSGASGSPTTGWDRRLGIDMAGAESEAAHGDAIAEARRLRETAEPGGIRISPDVYDACQSQLGLEWDRSGAAARAGDSSHETGPSCVVATTLRARSPRAEAPHPLQRRANRVAAGAALAMAGVAAVGVMLTGNAAGPTVSMHAEAQWEPLSVRVYEARVGGLAFPHPFSRQDRARILLNVGVTNRTGREIDLRREDFRLEIGGREVSALPPLGWNTTHDDAILYMSVGPASAGREFRFDRQALLPGGTAIVGLQFDFPLDQLDNDDPARQSRLRWHPFARWTTGMIVERLGAQAPGLQYRGPAGHTRIDLSADPLGSWDPVAQSSPLAQEIAVYLTRQPVHVFNAHRVWRFVEQRTAGGKRPIVVDMRRWPTPDLAVRAFLESRVDRAALREVAFVADGIPSGISGSVFGARDPGAPRIWFARDTDAAAELIGRTPKGRVQLYRSVRSPAIEIREAAVRALGCGGDELSARLVTGRLLEDPVPAVRAAAARALHDRETKSPTTIRALARAASDTDPAVRDAAFAALARWKEWQAGRSAALRELERSRPSHHAVQIVGEARVRAAVPRMVELMENPALTLGATRALAQIGEPSVVPALLDTLSARQHGREEILRALGRLAKGVQREAVLPVLETASEDASFPVRQAAIDAAGSLGGPEAVGLCVRGLGDREFPVRQSAARALGKLKVNAAVEPLERALADPPVAREAAAALGAIHSPSARDALTRTSQRGDILARSAVEPVLAAWDK